MDTLLSIETVAPALKEVLERLAPGQNVQLVDNSGNPVAMLTPLKSISKWPKDVWWSSWDALASDVDNAWQGPGSALEILSEMRK